MYGYHQSLWVRPTKSIFLCVHFVYKDMDNKGKVMDNEELHKRARAFMRENKVVFDRLAKI